MNEKVKLKRAPRRYSLVLTFLILLALAGVMGKYAWDYVMAKMNAIGPEVTSSCDIMLSDGHGLRIELWANIDAKHYLVTDDNGATWQPMKVVKYTFEPAPVDCAAIPVRDNALLYVRFDNKYWNDEVLMVGMNGAHLVSINQMVGAAGDDCYVQDVTIQHIKRAEITAVCYLPYGKDGAKTYYDYTFETTDSGATWQKVSETRS